MNHPPSPLQSPFSRLPVLLLILLACPPVSLMGATSTGSQRESVSLNGAWEFLPVFESSIPKEMPGGGEWRGQTITVPSNYVRVHEYGTRAKWAGARHAWYRRDVEIPASWHGRSIHLRFEGVAHEAAVFLNGRRLLTHQGAYTPFEVDLTPHVRAGERHELVVLAAGLDAALRRDRNGSAISAGRTALFRYPVGTQYELYGIWGDVRLLSVPPIRLGKPVIRTSVREMTVSLQTDVEGVPAGMAGELRVELEILRDGQVQKKLGTVGFPADGTSGLSFAVEWPDAELWSPATPVLYDLKMRLRSGSEVLDEVSEPFGFREIRIEGQTVLLNESPLHLLGATLQRGYGPDVTYTDEFMRSFLRMCKDANLNYVRCHRAPMLPRHLAMCDQMGLLVESEMPIVQNAEPSLRFRDFRSKAMEMMSALVERDTNHPSLIIWSSGNELVASGAEREYVAELVNHLASADPSRIVVAEGDGILNGQANVFVTHSAVRPEMSYDVSTRSKYIKDRVENWPGDRPYLAGATGYYDLTRATPNDACRFIGEQAYQDVFQPAPNTQGHSGNLLDRHISRALGMSAALDILNVRLENELWGLNLHGWERRAITPVNLEYRIQYEDLSAPGMKPTRLSLNLHMPEVRYDLRRAAGENYQPNQLFLDTRNAAAPAGSFWRDRITTCFSGVEARSQLVVFNDSFLERKLRVLWGLKGHTGDWIHKPEVRVLDMEPGQVERLDARIEIPSVESRTVYRLSTETWDSRTMLHHWEQPIAAFPMPSLSPLGDIALWDPEKVAEAAFERFGMEANRLQSLQDLATADPDIVVLAPYSINREDFFRDADYLLAFAAQGGEVVQLEQDVSPRWLPFDLPLQEMQPMRAFLTPNQRAWNERVRRGESPPLSRRQGPWADPRYERLLDEDLAFWGDRNGTGFRVARLAFLKPVSPPIRTIVECASLSGLDAALLLEIPYGKGVIRLCQLDVLSNLERTPAAVTVLEALLAPIRTSPIGKRRRLWTNLKPDDEQLGELLHDLGDALVIGDNLPPAGVTLLSFESGSQNMPTEEQIRAFLETEGILWLHGLSGDEPDHILSLLPRGASLAPPRSRHQQLEIAEGGEIYLPGLSNSDLWWNLSDTRFEFPVPIIGQGLDLSKADVENLTVLAREPNFTVKDTSSPINACEGVTVENPLAGAVTYRKGRGRIIVDQIRWDLMAKYRRTGLALPAALLDHFDVRPTTPKAPLLVSDRGQMITLDLTDAVTRGFRDEVEEDQLGGWTDQGPNDLRDMPVGPQIFSAIPFDIIDPRKNDNKSAILLGKETRPYFPSRVLLNVDQEAKRIHFLHTGAWTISDGEIFRYRINYQDGSSEEFPIRRGIEFEDWWVVSGDLEDPGSERIKIRTRDETRALYITTWNNPYPEKTIDSIEMELRDPQAVAILLAITLEQ